MQRRRNFIRMFKFMRPYSVMYAVGMLFYGWQMFIFPMISGVWMSGMTEGILAQNFSQVLNSILFMGIMMIVVMILTGIGAYLYMLSTNFATRDFQIKLFRAFMKSSLESEKHSGEGIAAINTDAATASQVYSEAITPFVMSLIAAVFSGVTVFLIDWRMGLAVAGVGLLAFFAQSRFSGALATIGKDRLDANADAVKSMSNILSGALTIRAFNRQDRALIQFDQKSGLLKKIDFKQAIIGTFQNLIFTFQGWLVLVITFALGGFFVVNGTLYFPQIMMISPLAATVGQAMSQIGSNFAGLFPPLVAAQRAFDIIDDAPDAEFGKDKRQSDWNGKYDLTFSGLDFSFKNAEKPTLNDIRLNIKEGTMVAFVGPSGSGKSTILRTVIGLYERDGLAMKLGNLPFSSEVIYDWRSHFAYVDQSCKLFDMSIAENIAMGIRGNLADDANAPSLGEVEDAAKRAFAHDFISDLPEGYDTSCGEKGASLSGGQKQRLAIARALCRKAPILVFDEATSALDADSERNVMETIQNLRRDHTILITTHNLHTIEDADMIVVMDEGRIAETGTHEELIKRGGKYWALLVACPL